MATNKVVKMRLCQGHDTVLQCSGQVKETDFYISYSKFSSGFTPYCKSCVNKIFNMFFDDCHDTKLSTYYTLQKIDIPFRLDVYNNALEKATKSDKAYSIKDYMTEYSKSNMKATYSDFSASDALTEENVLDSMKNTAQQLTKWRREWGDLSDVSDYEYLDERYALYTDDKELTPSQSTLYHKLCLAELSSRRHEAMGESTKEDIQQVLTLMGKLKIDDFKVKKDSEIDRILERQVWEIENTEPAEVVDKDEYKDFLSLHSEWGECVLRCVKNLLIGSKDYPNITKDTVKY